MKLMKKAFETTITRKRPPDDSNHCDLERFKKPQRMVQVVHDFSPGCGIRETDRKHVKKLIPKLGVEKNNQLNNLRANKHGRIKPETGSSTTFKCRFSHQTCSKSTQRNHLDEIEYDELKGNEVADLKRKKALFGSKHAGEVNVIHKKRPPEDSKSCDPERFKKQKRMVQAVHDFSPACGIRETGKKPNEFGRIKPEIGSRTTCEVPFSDQTCSKNAAAQKPKLTTTVVTQRNPLKHLDKVVTDHSKMTSHYKDKTVNFKPVKYDELKRTDPAHFKRNTPSFGTKPLRNNNEFHDKQPKVTTTSVSRGRPLRNNNGEDKKPSFGSKEVKAQISEVPNTSNLSRKEDIRREKIKDAMKYFHEVYTELYEEDRLKPKIERIAHGRVPVEAAKLVQQKFKWMEPKKRLGPICGVNIGDEFKFRSQLTITGLHCQLHSGIDYANFGGKKILAISIVDSHRYSNERISSDVLIYCGHGGLGVPGRNLLPKDQKLERGNLALMNSLEERKPVRVIRKIDHVYVYDGLYLVDLCTLNKSDEGKIMFRFHLNREPGQPSLLQMRNAP